MALTVIVAVMGSIPASITENIKASAPCLNNKTGYEKGSVAEWLSGPFLEQYIEYSQKNENILGEKFQRFLDYISKILNTTGWMKPFKGTISKKIIPAKLFVVKVTHLGSYLKC